jgi:hypothetical protein
MSKHIWFDIDDLMINDSFISSHAAMDMIMDYEVGSGPKPPFKYEVEEEDDDE